MPSLTVSSNEITDASRATNTEGDGLSSDSSFGIHEATTNGISNGGLETNTTGWFARGAVPATIARVTSASKFGVASLRCICDGTGGGFQGGETAAGTSGMAVTAGLSYTGSAWVQGDAGGESVRVVLGWYTAAGAFISSDLGTTTVLTTSFQRLTLTATAPGTAAFANIIVETTGAIVATFYIDGAQFEEQPLATPYVETDGATASRSAARAQAPSSLIDETQGWVAMRVRMGHANGLALGYLPYVFEWQDDGSNRITCFLDVPNGALKLDRGTGGTFTTLTVDGQTWARDDVVTLIYAWTATTLKASKDGAAFSSTADTNIPTLAAANFGIGNSGASAANHIDGDVLWFACGTGTLTDADAARIHAFGNTDKAPEDFNGVNNGAPVCTAAWYADTSSYEDETFILPTAVELPRVRVDIDFDNNPTSSTRTWTNVSSFVRGLEIQRGRDNPLNQPLAGRLAVTLDNQDRRFDPTYTSSPYDPNIKMMRRIRVRYRWNNTNYNRFHGYIDALPQEWPGEGNDAIVRLTATDAFKVLNLYDLNGKSYAPHLSATRIGTVLSDTGFGTAERSLDTGQSTMVASGTLTSTTALAHVLDVSRSENGVVYVDGGGTIRFHDRHHRIKNNASVEGTVGDADGEIRYIDARAPLDDFELWNQVMVTANGGTAETVTDTSSTALYYTRVLDWPPGGEYLVSSQNEAESAAGWLLRQYAEPALRVDIVTTEGARGTTWATLFDLDISDRIIFRRRPPGGGTIAEEQHVEMLVDRWEVDDQLEIDLGVSPTDPQSYWVLGDATLSKLGETTNLAY